MREGGLLVREALLAFVAELAAALDDHLAAQVPGRIWDRCGCGAEECASVSTAPTSVGRHGLADCTPVDLDPGLVVDGRAGRIHGVEVLYRPDVRAALDQAFGRE